MAVNKSEKGESIATETLELLERIKTDKRTRWRDQIIKINAPLVEKIAREYSAHIPNAVAELDDLRQLCRIGVNRAIDNDHKRRGNFSAFARVYMVEEMRRYRRSHWGIPRVWLEARDTVQTRKRLYEKLTGREISEEFVATQSMGISAELLREIITGYWQHATDRPFFGSAFGGVGMAANLNSLTLHAIPTPPNEDLPLVGSNVCRKKDDAQGIVLAIHRRHIFECEFNGVTDYLFRLEFLVVSSEQVSDH